MDLAAAGATLRRAQRTAAGSTSAACSSSPASGARSAAPTAPEPQHRSTTTGRAPPGPARQDGAAPDEELGAAAGHEDAGLDGDPQAAELRPAEDVLQRLPRDAPPTSISSSRPWPPRRPAGRPRPRRRRSRRRAAGSVTPDCGTGRVRMKSPPSGADSAAVSRRGPGRPMLSKWRRRGPGRLPVCVRPRSADRQIISLLRICWKIHVQALTVVTWLSVAGLPHPSLRRGNVAHPEGLHRVYPQLQPAQAAPFEARRRASPPARAGLGAARRRWPSPPSASSPPRPHRTPGARGRRRPRIPCAARSPTRTSTS